MVDTWVLRGVIGGRVGGVVVEGGVDGKLGG